MQIFKGNDKISIYGNLNINNHKNKIKEKVYISVVNQKLERIAKVIYDFLDKQYQRFNYNWDSMSKTTKTDKVVINNDINITKGNFKLYGYIEDWNSIFTDNGKKYNFHTEEIAIEELIQTIESIYDDYICDFDTIKDELKIIVTKIEIY